MIATGTIGACPLIAMMNPPFLKGKSSPVRLRVPSGKIRNEFPSRERLRRPIDGRQALVPISALERNEPGQIEGPPQHRQLAQLGLIQDT